jgi:four helix bundle protein
MNSDKMKRRTKELAKRMIEFCRVLPNNREGRLIGNQLFKSGTSVAANYRAACRGRSRADFIAKLGIVEEEADETLFWLEVINEMGIGGKESTPSLMQECDEIIAIIVSSIKTARQVR